MTASGDKTVILWTVDKQKLKLLQVLESHQNSVHCAIFADDNTIVSGDHDGLVFAWKLDG